MSPVAHRAAHASDSIFKQPMPDTRSPSRDAMRPSSARTFHPKRGRGERRVPAAPAAPCAKVESTRVVTADTPEHPAFPHAMVLTVSFVLSLVTGLDCHHHPCDAKHHHELDASVGASGPHDFAVRTQCHSSALNLRADMQRPSRPAPNVRDDRDTPLLRVRDNDGR